MTDQQAILRNAAFPHLSLEAIAYSAGRNSVDFETVCQFTDKALIAAWKRGRRSAMAEDALDRDTEWDSDEGY